LHLYDIDIHLKDPSRTGDIAFEVCSETASAEFRLSLFETDGVKDYRFAVVGESEASIGRGTNQLALEEFFNRHPPIVWFSDGSSLDGNRYTELKRKPTPYPAERILAWDWSGTDIRREAQGVVKEPTSIQYRVIEHLKWKCDVVFDDDGSGEAADIIGVVDGETRIAVEFYHCKFSREDTPGHRVDDLYVVCGQAQKSIHWREDVTDLFEHMQRRETTRERAGQPTRFEKGTRDTLRTLTVKAENYPVDISVFVVQPGLSKAAVSHEQLELLSVTENYLMETYQLPFTVIAST